MAAILFPCGPAGSVNLPPAVTDSAELTQFLARISAPSGARKTAYATLIDGLVADGVWSLIDGLYILAAADAATARTNLKQSSYGLTANGGLTFTADQGYLGDGSSGYLTTGYDPATSGGNFPSSGNLGTLAAYDITSDATGGFQYLIHTGGNVSFICPLFAGDIYTNIGGSGPNATAGGNARGSIVVSRTGATAAQLYKNGAANGALFTTAAAGGSSGTITLLANTGGSGAFLPHRLAAAMFGGGLNGTQALAYMSRVYAYMNPLGINTY